MGNLTSPGIQTLEKDESLRVPVSGNEVAAFAGFFGWGPMETPTLITSVNDLIVRFGKPTRATSPANRRSWLMAESFLKYSGAMYVSRAKCTDASKSDLNAFIGCVNPPVSGPISDIDDVQTNGLNTVTEGVGIIARYAGSVANGCTIYIVHDSNWDELNAKHSSVLSSLPYRPNSTPWLDELSKARGYDVQVVNAVASKKGKSDSEPSAPKGGKGAVASPAPAPDADTTLKDEVHVVVVDSEGLFSESPGTILEIFTGLSLMEGAKDVYGEMNFIGDVLAKRSDYIYYATEGATVTRTDSGATTELPELSVGIFKLSGGSDRNDLTDVATDVSNAAEVFADPQRVVYDFLYAYIPDADDAASMIQNKLIAIAEKRRDIIAFISPPTTVAGSNSSTVHDRVKKFYESITASAFSVRVSTPIYVRNSFTGEYLWIPSSGHVAGLVARTAKTDEPWFSPAGQRRGQLVDVIKIAYSPSQGERDELYAHAINSIVSSPGEGIFLFGDKTGTLKPSAFDRINVRRLFNIIERSIAKTSKFVLFELNDELTRLAFVNTVTPYLRDIQGRRGILDFNVVCDETNNTPAVIDSNGFVATIRVKPEHSINYITLNFVATKSGVKFDEI